MPIQTKSSRAAARRALAVNLAAPNTTGDNPWWTYEEGDLPGIGTYQVNIANGNVLAQAVDVSIKERGIPLTFNRSFNSQSGRNWTNTDGSANPGQFGNGWTNTFDSHVALNSSSSGISVFDTDGARYDYVATQNLCYTPPAGQYASLCSDGSTGFEWTRKDGTILYFYSPTLNPNEQALAGRLYKIIGRNTSDVISFNYYWQNGDASVATNLTTIIATHTGNKSLTLTFGALSGGQVVLSSLQRPDGVAITYAYDSSGDLASVTEPSNGSGYTTQTYLVNGTDVSFLSPRYVGSGYVAGGGVVFSPDSSGRTSSITHFGVANFTPSDGTNTLLQPAPAPTGIQVFDSDQYTYGNGQTQVQDTNGRGTTWNYDSIGRVSSVVRGTGITNLTESETWDTNNNTASTTDFRQNLTNYAYDANGNLVAEALPSITTSDGTFRPTYLYSYDQNNNLTASCDPHFVNTIRMNWSGTGPVVSDTLCPQTLGSSTYQWTTTSNEPYGEIISQRDPVGYIITFAYDQNSEGGGDYGLVTAATGASFNQSDNTQLTPKTALIYDSFGNVVTSENGLSSTTFTFDANNNNVLTSTDADNVTSYTYYYPNGSIQETESSTQHVLDAGSAPSTSSLGRYLSYDSDGNLTSQTSHYNCVSSSGCSAGKTTYWYDAADRLVETQLPSDPNIDSGTPTGARYLYDLSQGSNGLKVGNSSSFSAYGGLYKIQEYNVPPCCGTATSWQDEKGSAYDALGRVTQSFQYAPGNSNIQAAKSAFDKTTSTLGLLSNGTNALGESTSYSYDADGNATSISFAADGGVTPARSYVYDSDGRISSRTSAGLGTETFSYDSDGRVATDQEPSGGGETAPSTFLFDYLGTGWRKDVRVQSAPAPLSGTQTLLTYVYRIDSKLASLTMQPYGKTFSWTYSPAGRVRSKSDPFTGAALPGQGPNAGPATIASDAYTYSSTGNISTHQYPDGTTQNNYQDDAEDEPVSMSIVWSSRFNSNLPLSATAGFSYSSRGELISSSPSNATYSYVRGYPVPSSDHGTRSYLIDQLSGALLQYSYNGSCGPTEGMVYDAAGRRTNVTATVPVNCQPSGWTNAATYDTENHALSSGTIVLKWGPNGHPIVVSLGNPTFTYTLHWSRDELLYVTDSSGNLVEFFIGNAGVLFVNGMQSTLNVVIHSGPDRVMTYNNNTGIEGPDLANGQYNLLGGANIALDPTGGAGALLWAGTGSNIVDNQRTDGFGFGGPTALLTSGGRSYDPQTSQWTTPDALVGDVSDPRSLNEYQWVDDNPIGNIDPTGLEPEDSSTACADCDSTPLDVLASADPSSSDASAGEPLTQIGQTTSVGGFLTTIADVSVVAMGSTIGGDDPLFGDEDALKDLQEKRNKMPYGKKRSALTRQIDELKRGMSNRAHGADKAKKKGKDKFQGIQQDKPISGWPWLTTLNEFFKSLPNLPTEPMPVEPIPIVP